MASLVLKCDHALTVLWPPQVILYRIYPPLYFLLIAYSLIGTTVTLVFGKPLVKINRLQAKKEADFRFGLVRLICLIHDPRCTRACRPLAARGCTRVSDAWMAAHTRSRSSDVLGCTRCALAYGRGGPRRGLCRGWARCACERTQSRSRSTGEGPKRRQPQRYESESAS